jgi:hypothetical protein
MGAGAAAVTDNERRNDQTHRADEPVGVAELVVAARASARAAVRLLSWPDLPLTGAGRRTEARAPAPA